MRDLILSLLLICSCGKDSNLLNGTEISSDINYDVQIAVAYIGEKSGNKPISKIVMLDDREFGCKNFNNKGGCITNATCTLEWKRDGLKIYFDRSIKIRRGAWNNMSTYSRYSVIIHEVLHCAYDIKHDDYIKSIMIFSERNDLDQREFLEKLNVTKEIYGF